MANDDRLKSLNDGGYNNLLIFALVGVVIYLLVSGFNKSKKQTYLDNAGTDKNTQQAQALRDAMNRSGIGLLMSIDGSDVDLIMQTAQQITDYKAVADSYRVIYPGSELTTDLQNELSRTDMQAFWDIVNGNAPTTSTGGTTSGGTTATKPSLVGKQVKAIQTTNIRIDKSPYGVESNIIGQNIQAKANDILGAYVSEKVLPNVPYSGNSLVYVRYKESSFFGDSYHWVLKSAVKIG